MVALALIFSGAILGQAPVPIPIKPYIPPSSLPGGFPLDTQNKSVVRNFFNAVYYSGTRIPSGWNGSVTNCDAGATSAAWQEAVRTRINFFRAMAGVPSDIQFDPEYSAKAQHAALIVSANLSISHDPADYFTCLSVDGIQAAAVSNLALGTSGVDSIEAYILDAGNNYRVGHRRFLLYPQTKFMGNGDIDPSDGSSSRRANANWVIDENFWSPRPATRDGFVAWPPPGFVPHQIVYPRWSFSFPHADFTSATVTVTTNGVLLPIHLEDLALGYAENTIVFVPGDVSPSARVTAPAPSADLTYNVAISGVLIDGLSTNFNYSVTVFDPAAATESAELSGPPEPELGRGNRFVLPAIDNASAYDFRVGTLIPFRRVENAEPFADIIANISALYPVVQTNIFVSTNAAFHLAHTTPARPQTFQLNRTIIPSDRSELRFQSRLGAASTGQVARVQVSLDEGSSWREIYAQPGDGLSGELAFVPRRISLAEFAGRAIQIRFEYGFTFGELTYAPGFGAHIGWYLDDITVTSAQELLVESVVTSPKPEFAFEPNAQKTYHVDARPRFFDRFTGEWTAGTVVTAVAPSPAPAEVRVVGIRASAQGLELIFEPTNTRTSAVYRLETAENPTGPWTVEPSAIQSETDAHVFRLPNGPGPARFFRVTIE